MRKLIYVILLLVVAASSNAQQNTVSAKTVQATIQLIVAGTGIDSISKDPNFIGNSDRRVPTQKAVKTYVGNQILTPDSTKVYNTPAVAGARVVRGSNDTLYQAVLVAGGGIDAVKSSDSSKITFILGGGGRSGATTLVTGQKVLAISGLTTSSLPFVTLISSSGASSTVKYKAVCTTNTLTITAVLADGTTTNTADVSVISYFVIN